MTVIVYEHPLSPYAQKVKLALDEKGVTYQTRMPAAIGSGQPDQEFLKANPRGEVPALIDGDVKIFDSTIILEYIEDKWPTPALLPKSPAARADARTIEDVMGRLGQPMEKTHWIMDKWGYTGSACIPMALDDAVEKGLLRPGMKVIFCATGGGMAMACNAWVWTGRA